MRNTRLAVVPAALLSVTLVAGCGPSDSKDAASKAGAGVSNAAGSATDKASGAAGNATDKASGAASDATGSDSATSCPTENTKNFAKTRFVTDLGLAAGTFHRYIYKPYQAGSFTKGHIDKSDAIKAGIAAAADYKLLKNASENAKANPTLCNKVAQPLSDALDKVKSVKTTDLLAGNVGGLAGAYSAIQGAMSGSKSAGQDVTENDNLSKAKSLAG